MSKQQASASYKQPIHLGLIQNKPYLHYFILIRKCLLENSAGGGVVIVLITFWPLCCFSNDLGIGIRELIQDIFAQVDFLSFR